MAFKKSKRSFKKRTTKKSSRRPAKKTSIKRVVRKAIQSAAEKKVANFNDFSHSVVGSNSASAATQIVPVCPTTGGFEIQQGPSQDERIGNKIHVIRGSIKGTIHPNPYNATTNILPQPILVQMFVFWDKENTTTVPNPFSSNDFFQLGSTSQGFQNHVVDTWLPINTDRWSVVHRQTFKVGTAAYEGTGINAGAQAFTNNDFKFNCNYSVDLTKDLVKNVKYNDNNIDATTRGLYVMWVACEADGGTLPAAAIPCQVCFSADLKYTDL